MAEYIAAVSCSADGAMLGGAGLVSGTTGKPCRAWNGCIIFANPKTHAPPPPMHQCHPHHPCTDALHGAACWLKTFVRSNAHHKIFFKLQRTGFSFVLNIFIDYFVPYSDYQKRLLRFGMLQIFISKWHTKTHVFAWYVQEPWSVVGNVIHFFKKTSINNLQV